MNADAMAELNREVIGCRLCPRLEAHCKKVAVQKRRAFSDCEYWAKPVPGFGDLNARVMILGLAPGAHGSNRTGRPFTGDASGRFLYPVLHATGFASQPQSIGLDDGLRLQNAYITAVVRCAPPGNKPTSEEIANCSGFLDREIGALSNIRVVVALGRIGFVGYLDHQKRTGKIASRAPYTFGHGRKFKMPNGIWLLASYHPSQQNTLTGKLTQAMFTAVFREASRLAQS